MATRSCVTDYPAKGVMRAVWSGLLNGDSGAELCAPQYPYKTVQVTGTFGAGGTVKINGSNTSGGTQAQLNDPGSTALTLTTAAVEGILENPFVIAPSVTAGDGTTSLTVTIIGRTEA